MRARRVTISAMFMMEGFRDCDYNKALLVWNQGAIELTNHLADWAEEAERMYDALSSGDHSGVYEYEVCSPFGTWFGTTMVMTGEPPTLTQSKEALTGLVEEFSKRNSE